MNECHFDEGSEVFGCLFKTSKHASSSFQPSHQALHDVEQAVCFAIEFHRTRIAVLVLFGRNDRLDVSFQQIFVNPIGAVSFVTAQRYGPRDRFARAITEARVGALQHRVQRCGLVFLAGG
jgi:hypothetical protein